MELHPDLIEHFIAKNAVVIHPYSYAITEMSKQLNVEIKQLRKELIAIVRQEYYKILDSHDFKLKLKPNNMISLPAHYITDSVNANGDLKKYLNSQFWIDGFNSKYKYWGVFIDTGAGKSTSIGGALTDIEQLINNLSIAIMNGRAANTKAYQSTVYDKLRVVNQYYDNGETGNITSNTFDDDNPPRFACTINSIPQILKKSKYFEVDTYKIVILDELKQILGQLYGDACEKQRISVQREFKRLIADADKVFIADATLDHATLQHFTEYFAIDADENLQLYEYDLRRWENVKVYWIEKSYSFYTAVNSLVSKTIMDKFNNKSVGLRFYFNSRTDLDHFIDDMIKQLLPKIKNDSSNAFNHLVNWEVVNAVTGRDKKFKFRIGVASKRTAKSSPKFTIYEIDYTKPPHKALNIIDSRTARHLSFDKFVSDPSEMLDKFDIDILAHTPVIETAISIAKCKRFDTVVSHIKPSFKTSGASGGYQSLGRTRDSKKWFIYVTEIQNKKDGSLLTIPEIDSKEKIINEIKANSNKIKVNFKDNALAKLATNDDDLISQQADFQYQAKIDQQLYTPLLYDMVAKAVGEKNISIFKQYTPFKKPNKSDKDLRLESWTRIDQTYTPQEMAEIEASKAANFGICILDDKSKVVFDVDKYEMSLHLKQLSINDLNYTKNIVTGYDENGFYKYADWDKSDHNQRYDMLEFATEVIATRRTLENADAIVNANKSVNKGLQKLENQIITNATYIDENKSLKFKPTTKDLLEKFKTMRNDALVLNWLYKQSGAKNLNMLLNSGIITSYSPIVKEPLPETITHDKDSPLPIIDDKAARSILRLSDDKRYKPMLSLSNSLNRMGLELVATQKRGKADRGEREYQVKVKPSYNVIAGVGYKQSEFQKRILDKGQQKYERFLTELSRF